MTSEVLCVSVNQWAFLMMDLESAIKLDVTYFFELGKAGIGLIYKGPSMLRNEKNYHQEY